MNDIADRADVEALVTAFYETAFEDALLGHIFIDVAKMDLAHHLPVMCDFWETALFNAGVYRRNALQLHVALSAKHPLTGAHFTRWLSLWNQTVDARFTGPVAERAKLHAVRAAGSMQRAIAGRSGSAFETIARRDDSSPEG